MRLPDPSKALDKNCATMGCGSFIQYWGWGLEKGSMAFPDSSSVLDKIQSAIMATGG